MGEKGKATKAGDVLGARWEKSLCRKNAKSH